MNYRIAGLTALVASMALLVQACGEPPCDTPTNQAVANNFQIIAPAGEDLLDRDVPFDSTSTTVSISFSAGASVASLSAANIIIEPDSATAENFVPSQGGNTWTFDVTNLTPGTEYNVTFAGVDDAGSPRFADAEVIRGVFPNADNTAFSCPNDGSAGYPLRNSTQNPNIPRDSWQKTLTVASCDDFELGLGNGGSVGGVNEDYSLTFHSTADASDAGEDARNIVAIDLAVTGMDLVDLGPRATAGTCSDSDAFGIVMTIDIVNNGTCDWDVNPQTDGFAMTLMRQEGDKDGLIEATNALIQGQDFVDSDDIVVGLNNLPFFVINDINPGTPGGTIPAGGTHTETLTLTFASTEGTLGDGCPAISLIDADQVDPTKRYYIEAWLVGNPLDTGLSQDATALPAASAADFTNIFEQRVQSESFALYNSDAFNSWVRVNDDTSTTNLADVMCFAFVSNDADGEPWTGDSLLAGGSAVGLANSSITNNAQLSTFFFGDGITDRFDVLNPDDYDDSYSADASQMATYLLSNSHTMDFADIQASWGLTGTLVSGVTFFVLGPLGHHFSEGGQLTKNDIVGGSDMDRTYHGDFEDGNFVGRFKFERGKDYWMRCSPGAGFIAGGGNDNPTLDPIPMAGLNYVISIDSEVDNANVVNTPPTLPTVGAATVTTPRHVCFSSTGNPVIIDATGDNCASVGTRTEVTDTTIVIDGAGNDTINAQFTAQSDVHWYKIEVPQT